MFGLGWLAVCNHAQSLSDDLGWAQQAERAQNPELALVEYEAIVAHCKKHLAGFKVPRFVVFGELPKTSTGKIQKFQLRERAKSSSAIE
jgi:acyl-CoA synthetase (AMP-forming)/AMP-acid ligase II